MSGSACGHVMISYDHQHKEIARALNKRLQEMGYNTWIDVEQMRGDIIDAMSAAVQDSCVVIVCYSENYKNRENCMKGILLLSRTKHTRNLEAKYIMNTEKPYIMVRVEPKYKPTD